ncbi:rhodanese-like domain-containing protein [Clostridium senegalense]|uniref:rhodanese-like domain-containing protein n=1 Tax=Clostridium senegalense TaxID=1465809 RepID=UPI0002DBD040|nr:rhodanese-like domain-containing protein [Clostridium senegalense]
MNKRTKLILTTMTLAFSIFTFTGCSNSDKGKSSATSDIKTIESEEVKENIEKSDWIIVDTRENDAFNGWKLDGISRGGHIKGATDFSAAWLKIDNKDKDITLDKALETKGISKDKNVILYDANGKDATEVANYLSNKGYSNLYTYDIKQWAQDSSNPMETYENYQMLVPASWVKDLIDGKHPETYDGKDYKVFEVSWGKEQDSPSYLKDGHIPGSVHINTDDIEKGPLWNRVSDEELEKFAVANGITKDTTTVLYGDDSMAAFRVVTILKYMGVEDVRVLNGGTNKWVKSGYELEKTSNKPVPVKNFGAKVPANKNYIVDLDMAKDIINDKKNSKLVDIRSWEEFIGETSGYDYIKTKGRPVGCVWGHAGTDAKSLQDYRNIDNTMRNKDEIINMWNEWGITPNQRLAFYCGTGWRAAEVLYYADVMGVKNIALYDGGWNEWSGNTGNEPNPIETGDPVKVK